MLSGSGSISNQNFESGSIIKVPKCEIFDLSDFPDFCTIKSLRVADFRVKIKKLLKKYLGVHLGVQSSLRVCSVYLKEVFL